MTQTFIIVSFTVNPELERLKEVPPIENENLTKRPIAYKERKIGCKLVLTIINRKSHIGFRLVQKSMTLNDLERRNDRRRALSLR